MYKNKFDHDVRDSIREQKGLTERLRAFIKSQYLKPSARDIYRVAISEWLDRNENRSMKRGRRPK